MKATIAIESRTSKPALRVDLRKAGRKLMTAAYAVAMPVAASGILALWAGSIVENPSMALRGAMAAAVGIALMTARLQSESTARKGGTI